MSLVILQQMLEDADLFGYIQAGVFINAYDSIAQSIFPKISKDMTTSQLESVIWDAFYEFMCCGSVGDTKEPFALDRSHAEVIIGSPERFKGIALNIRHIIFGI